MTLFIIVLSAVVITLGYLVIKEFIRSHKERKEFDKKIKDSFNRAAVVAAGNPSYERNYPSASKVPLTVGDHRIHLRATAEAQVIAAVHQMVVQEGIEP